MPPFRKPLSVTAQIDFSHRKKLLNHLGYADFATYRDSEQYKEKQAILLKRKPACFGCGEKAYYVLRAFDTVENLDGESFEGLWTVCKACYFKCTESATHRLSSHQSIENLLVLYSQRQKHQSKIEEDGVAFKKQPQKNNVTPIGKKRYGH